MHDFRAGLTALLDSLLKNPFVEIERDYIGEPLEIDEYEAIVEQSGITPAEGLRELYCSMGACEIEWTCDLDRHAVPRFTPDDRTVTGRILIRPLEGMLAFDRKLEAPWWTAWAACDRGGPARCAASVSRSTRRAR